MREELDKEQAAPDILGEDSWRAHLFRDAYEQRLFNCAEVACTSER